jgi:hypothetical protein
VGDIHARIRQNKRDKVEKERYENIWYMLDRMEDERRAAMNYPRDVRVVTRV